jgi:RNA polymerase sigma-70 factor, ECF subfamily
MENATKCQTPFCILYRVIIAAMNEPEEEVPPAEDVLISRARAVDRDAFEQIFNTYRNQVYSLAYRMTGSASDAEDLTQEVFMQVMRKIGSFQGRSSFSTWLYRVTVNRSRDYMRSRKRNPELLSDDQEAVERVGDPVGAAPAPAPESGAIASEARRLVQEALMELPVSLRAPLVMHELEGMEYREVARMLRLPVGTVKSRIFRGRLKLAELLEPHKEQWR